MPAWRRGPTSGSSWEAAPEPGSGSEANASYMLETGVHQLGRDIRIFAVLFDMDTMNVVKSHKWTATADGLFALSEDLAEEVARSVEVELVVGEPARLYAELDDPAAREKVYLGWYHLRNDTKEGWQRALELFGAVATSHPMQPTGGSRTSTPPLPGRSSWRSRAPRSATPPGCLRRLKPLC